MRPLGSLLTRQPAGFAQIDWSNPIAKGLRWWTGAPQQSLRAAVPTSAGQAFAPSASVVTGPSIAVGGLSDITMLSFGVLNGTANAGNYQAGIRIGATLARLEAFTGNTQVSAVCSYSDFTSTTIAATAHGVSVTGGIMALGLRHIRGATNGVGLFVNGRLLASNTAQNKTLVNTAANVEAHWAQAGTNQDYLTSLNALWDRALSDQEIASLSTNPWQLFLPSQRLGWYFSTATVGAQTLTPTRFDNTQAFYNAAVSYTLSSSLFSNSQSFYSPAVSQSATTYRPSSDVSANGWTATPGGSLASCIDEITLDRSDFITSPNLTNPATLTWTTSFAAGSYDVTIDADRTGATGQVRIVCLDSGGTSVGATSWQTLTGTATTYTLPVTTTGTSTQFRIEVQ